MKTELEEVCEMSLLRLQIELTILSDCNHVSTVDYTREECVIHSDTLSLSLSLSLTLFLNFISSDS